jgi:hypothetical protein
MEMPPKAIALLAPAPDHHGIAVIAKYFAAARD